MSIRIKGTHPQGLEITRKTHGVPHIKALDLPGVFWGMGYCHAMDRGLQMLIMRILGQGRGCECLDDSDDMLEVDRFFRKLNWGNHLQEQWNQLDAESQGLLQEYTRGVNAYLQRSRPWECRLVGYKPTPWLPEDTLMITRMAGYLTLAQSQGEVEKFFIEMVQAGVENDKLASLFPVDADNIDRGLLSKIRLEEKLVPESLKWLCPVPRAMASNNWVISGSKTSSGKAMLCNDPHLEVNRLPAVWYEQTAQWGDNYAMGANMPGLPGIIVGRTRHLSWGATYPFMDNIDSWMEDCKDGKYRRGDQWQDFTVRKETIQRKKHDPLQMTIYENPHGVLDGNPNEAGLYLTTCWAPSRSGAKSIEAIKVMMEATTVEQGMAAMGQLEVAFNFVFADTRGNIGYQMSGLYPLRKEGVNGFMPVPGWDPEYDWRGFASHEDLPREINPAQGFIVTANQDQNHQGVLDPANMPMGDYRFRRISHLLDERGDHDFHSSRSIQMDTYSIQAREYLEVLLPLLPESRGKSVLKAWDCRYDLDSQAALLFETFYSKLRKEVFGKGYLGEAVVKHLEEQTGIFIDFYQNFDRLLMDEKSPWYTEFTRDQAFAAAFEQAVEGYDWNKTWGEVNQVMLTNIFFGGKVPAFLGFDHGPIPLRGGRATPHQGQIYTSGGRKTSFAPSYRMITDMGEDVMYTANAGGASDRRFSPHYKSGVQDWLEGKFKKMEIR
ncbi:MAG: penicillin acylase family protein [Desulfatibacillum sp.]|nr:penicillin acylase family protein [Desulfatibacillum sp.]